MRDLSPGPEDLPRLRHPLVEPGKNTGGRKYVFFYTFSNKKLGDLHMIKIFRMFKKVFKLNET
jgi:hypothetical protein